MPHHHGFVHHLAHHFDRALEVEALTRSHVQLQCDGELMLFDNSRVLHGRTSYDPIQGHRHLQGCYIDLDGPLERLSEIRKRNTSTEEVA